MIHAIRNETKKIPISFLCRYFGATRSGYYNWCQRENTLAFAKKAEICEAIKEIFKEEEETYGSPRVCLELKSRGYKISENTVAKYMRELGLDARLKKRFKVQTTDSDHDSPIADRLIKVEDENTLPTGPGEVLAGDITYLRLGASFLYLAVVMDLFTREIVGWSIQKSLHTKIVLDALESAMQKVGPDAEIVFHSDRGSQYASEAYRDFCDARYILPSMSRRGNCYDNSYVESWFAGLKKEKLYRSSYNTEQELRALVFDYIEVRYNRRRRHSALGGLSPLEFRENYFAAQ